MIDSYLNALPRNLQNAILQVYNKMNYQNKAIFLARLQYGKELPYVELSEIVGLTFQDIHQMYCNVLEQVKKSPYLFPSGVCANI